MRIILKRVPDATSGKMEAAHWLNLPILPGAKDLDLT